MPQEPTLFLEGNLVSDPELRYFNDVPFASFSIAHGERKKDGDNWVDGETLFMNCSCNRQMAQNLVNSLRKGDRVLVAGRLKANVWEDKETKQERRSVKLAVDAVGPSLRFAEAAPHKNEKGSTGSKPGKQSKPSANFEPEGDPWG